MAFFVSNFKIVFLEILVIVKPWLTPFYQITVEQEGKLAQTPKNIRYTYILMELTQSELVNITFWNKSKNIILIVSDFIMTSLWCREDAIFRILGQIL